MSPERFTVCVVDDEPPARRALDVLLRRHQDVDVVGVCGDGASALTCIRETRPDVVFVDVRMPGLDGFDVVTRLGEVPPVIVFVTAYEAYAARAFEARALDYLVKPFSDERFEVVLARVRQAVQQRKSIRPLVVRDGHRTLVIELRDIEWIEAEDYYVRIHAGDRRPLVRQTLQSLLATLPAKDFMRVHRSAAVNVRAIREWQPLAAGDGHVRLASGQQVRVSRSFRAGLQAQLSAIGTASADRP